MTDSAPKSPTVALVIPGRNCAATLDRCLQSVVPLLSRSGRGDESSAKHNQRGDESPTNKQQRGDESSARGLVASSTTTSPVAAQLQEIIFVDDGSTDATAEIAARYPVRVIQGTGQGPGAARNLGWRATEADLVWFIDSDCVAEPDALEKLLPHMSDPNVAGVGGSYSNLYPDNLIATLIHEEIVARHRRMGSEVNFLATFNVLYRRAVLQQTDGFNEDLKLAQDAELAFRIIAAGHRLRFDIDSKVGHHHPTNLWRYLKTQARQGFYRMALYRQHPDKIKGDSYAGLLDYLQPPLALVVVSFLSLSLLSSRFDVPASLCLVALVLVQLPLAFRVFPPRGKTFVAFAFFGTVRAVARGIGMLLGGAKVLTESLYGSTRKGGVPSDRNKALNSLGRQGNER